ncbi:MAG TPA: hypothetical protein VLA43_14955, partial [Longimicrobiales bacterium]|nr:hypothetical protein [Longimicrobiales bacterium]
MLGDVAGEARDVLGQLAQELPQGCVGPLAELGQRRDLLGQPRRGAVFGQLGQLLQLAQGQVERLA